MNRIYTSLTVIALFLAPAPSALASNAWYVDGVSGNDDNDCETPTTACRTIGHAISLASSGDSIVVAAATYAENLTISFSLNVIGSGPTTTIVDGGGHNTVVTVSNAGASVMLSNLTIRGGIASSAGGIYNVGTLTINNSTVSGNQAYNSHFTSYGGGVYNSGTMTINSTTISGNSAFARSSAWGGAITNIGTVTINKSTLVGNTAGCGFTGCMGGGGAIQNNGRLTINNSTLSGNSASADYSHAKGGAILNGSTLEINNSTLSSNTTSYLGQGGGLYNSGTTMISNSTLSGNTTRYLGQGSGIYNYQGFIVKLQNSIVSQNSGSNCAGTITSNGYNLSSDDSCNFSHIGDLNSHDPLLGPLQNNGGTTDTMALLAGSPAIDAGNPSGCIDGQGRLLTTDQRGMPRPDKEDAVGCDMGAYESQSDQP